MSFVRIKAEVNPSVLHTALPSSQTAGGTGEICLCTRGRSGLRNAARKL